MTGPDTARGATSSTTNPSTTNPSTSNPWTGTPSTSNPWTGTPSNNTPSTGSGANPTSTSGKSATSSGTTSGTPRGAIPTLLGGADQAAQRAGLRRMKSVAAGLLVAAAALFVLSVAVGHGHGAWGYCEAMAEAAMVGGLADWFAVTALFRHPLGLPIPHTAIIARKKDQIGASLGSFVRENFLTADVVGGHIAAAQVPRRIGTWLADPAHAARVSDEAALGLAGAAAVLRDDEIRGAVAQAAEQRLADVEVAPLLARVIDIVVDGGQHQVALTAGIRALMHFLDENRDQLRRRLSQESPEWVPNWIDDRVFVRLFTGMQSFLADIAAQDDHDFRRQFDERLRNYAVALRTDPVVAARVEAAKTQVLEHPAVRSWIGSLWYVLKSALLDAAADANSDLRRTVQSLLTSVGVSLRDDEDLQRKVDGWIQGAVGHVLQRYSADISGLISTTVARWDADDTSRRLELQVGRDLQFIRVNGTLVGALVGLVIHVVAQLL